MPTTARDRLVGGIGAAAVVGALGGALLFGMAVTADRHLEQSLVLLDPPPSAPPRRQREMHQRARKASAAAAPRNLRDKATDSVAVPPLVPLPVPVLPPVVTAPKADSGMAASTGASDLPGPGQGAGGQGTGSGGGGKGDGDGDDVPPRQIRGRLKFSDLSPDLREADRGGTVGVRYRVEVDGRVSGCVATASSGDPRLDAQTCRLIEQHFRFRPSRNRDGRPVRSIVEETHAWIIEPGPVDR